MGLLIKGLTVAVGVIVLLVDLNGAIVDDVGFSDTTGDWAVTADSTVLVTGFVELGTVKGLEVNDDEGEVADILFDVVFQMLVREDVGLGGDTSAVVFGSLEDRVDIVDVLGLDVWEKGDTVTVLTVDGLENELVVVVVFLKNGDCKGWTLEVNGEGIGSLAAVAFLLMYEVGLEGFFHEGSYVLGTAGACLLVVMLLALVLPGIEVSNFFFAWLLKLEL